MRGAGFSEDSRRSSQYGSASSTIDAEADIARYGGDDPYEPQELKAIRDIPPSSTAETPDRIIVSWDSPDDKENPQNWKPDMPV